jgi:hypothetical protein
MLANKTSAMSSDALSAEGAFFFIFKFAAMINVHWK